MHSMGTLHILAEGQIPDIQLEKGVFCPRERNGLWIHRWKGYFLYFQKNAVVKIFMWTILHTVQVFMVTVSRKYIIPKNGKSFIEIVLDKLD